MCKRGTNLTWVVPQVYKLGLLQVRVLVSLLSSSREGKPGLISSVASAGSGMVACLAGPGPEEDILLLDFDFLMSPFGEGFFCLVY